MDPVRTLGLPSLAGDLGPGRGGASRGGHHGDPFLAEVASHLIGAGGKRIRPTLTLCTAYAVADNEGPVSADAVTGAVAVELVHLGSLYHDDVIDEAETRRGVPSVNARWSNIVAILAGDFLLARASELAASSGRRGRRAARDHDRRAVPGPGARAAAPLRRRPQRGGLLLGDRGQDRRAVRHVVPHRRDGLRRRRADARRADPVRPPRRDVLPDRRRRARRHRDRRISSASPRARTSSRACTRCP